MRLSSPRVVIIDEGVKAGMILEGVVTGTPTSFLASDAGRAREVGRAVGAAVVVLAVVVSVQGSLVGSVFTTTPALCFVHRGL